jgi:hypothetical protein
MFVTTTRSTGDLAGVFEYTEHTGYFYLYDRTGEDRKRVLGAIHILSGSPDFEESDIEVRWAPGEGMVGIFIKSQLWAVFRDSEPFGGNYQSGGQPSIPGEILEAFATPRG